MRNFIQCFYVIYPLKIYACTVVKNSRQWKSIPCTLKQAKRASTRSRSYQTGYVVALKAPCKRTQHCWPTTPNTVGCCMLHVACCVRMRTLLHVVGSCCIRLHTTANTDATIPNIIGPTMLGIVASVCKTKLHDYSVFLCFQKQDGDYTRENS